MIRVFSSQKQKIGENGENEAVQYLVRKNFSIVERNVSFRIGEIDIVAKKNGVFYFFEVKSGFFGSIVRPEENLHFYKIKKFLKAVNFYRAQHNIREYKIQAIIVLFQKEGGVRIETLDLVL